MHANLAVESETGVIRHVGKHDNSWWLRPAVHPTVPGPGHGPSGPGSGPGRGLGPGLGPGPKAIVETFKISKVLRMGLPIVENLSGLQESIFSLFRSPQLHFGHKSRNWWIGRKLTLRIELKEHWHQHSARPSHFFWKWQEIWRIQGLSLYSFLLLSCASLLMRSGQSREGLRFLMENQRSFCRGDHEFVD